MSNAQAVLMIDPVRTKEAMREVAATFGTLANEKFMLEAEHIQSLPEEQRDQAVKFFDKQKERIQHHVEVAKNHLQHYVDLLMLAEAGSCMPIPRSLEEAEMVVGMMHVMAKAVLVPAAECKRRAEQSGKNMDGSEIPVKDPTKH